MAGKDAFSRGDPARESTEFTEIIRSRTDERESIHKKTFTKWINNKLSKADKAVHVKDLIQDLRDGHILLTLLETLLSIKLPREKGKMRLHKLTNVRIVFEQLEQNGVKIVGINNGDIVDGRPRPILGLVWSIILRFQVQEIFQEGNPDAKVKDFHVEKRLLSWCQDVLDGYEDVIKLKDFTTGWRNGLAFNAIIHSHKPDLFEFDDILVNDNKTNLQHAFIMAQNEFNVDALLEPSDIDVPQPDKKLIMMYLTSMYDVLKNYEPTRDRRNKRLQLKKELEAYRASHSEIMLFITQVESIVLAKLDFDQLIADPVLECQTAKDLNKDTADHAHDVTDVTLKGQKLIEDGKISPNEQQEIKSQVDALKIRWEKLLILVSRLNKSCQTALVAPKQKQIEYYVTWVRHTSRDVQLKGNATTPEEMRQEVEDIQEIMADIEENEPPLNVAINDAQEIIDDESIDPDVKLGLRSQLDVLVNDWEVLKKDMAEKQERLHKGIESIPEVIDVQDAGVVESPPVTSPRAFEIQIRSFSVRTPPTSPRSGKNTQVEKLRTWKRKHDEARNVISDCGYKVKKLKLEEESKTFYQQLELCNQSVRQAEAVVLDTVRYGQDVVKDKSIEEDKMEVVSQELEHLVAVYDELLTQLDQSKLEMDQSVENEKSKLKEDLEKWKTSRDKLRPEISEYYVKLTRAKHTNIPTDKRAELNQYAKELTDCEQQVTQLEPEVTEFLARGNKLVRNPRMSDSEKELVAMNMHEIDNQFRTIKQETTELKLKVNEIIMDEDAKKNEKMNEWKDMRDNLKPKIFNRFVHLKNLDRIDIIMRAKEIEACHQEVMSLDTEVSRFLDKSNELIQSEKLDDDEKSLVTDHIKTFDEEYEKLRSESNELKNEVEKRTEELDKKSFQLEKWRDWKRSIFNRLDSTQGNVNGIKSIETSRNLETLEENLALSEKCIQDLENLEPEKNSALEFGQQIKNGNLLSEEEKQKITDDMKQIEKRLKALKEDASNQNEWLKVHLEEQETSKSSSLKKWQDTKQNTSALIDTFQSKVNALNDNPVTKEDMESEIAKVHDYAEELPLIFQEVQSCFDEGSKLLSDDLQTQADKDLVQSDVEEIGNKLRTLQSDVDAQQERLQEQLRRKTAEEESEAMRYSKLSEWRRTRSRMVDKLNDFRQKFRSLQSLSEPKNAVETEKRINGTTALSNEIIAKFSDIESGFSIGNDLLNDDELTEDDKDIIERDMGDLKSGFENLKEDVNYEHNRLTKLLELLKSEESKMASWRKEKDNLDILLEEAKGAVRDLKSRPEPMTADEIDDQIDETQDVYQRMMSESVPKIDAGLDTGRELLKDSHVSDPNKDIIERDLNILEPAFKATREEFASYYVWLQALTPAEALTVNEDQETLECEPDQTDHGDPSEDRFVVRTYTTADQYLEILHEKMTPQERFEHEKKEKLHQWKSIIGRIDELLKRLMDRLNRLKSADPEDYNDVKAHRETAQDCIEEVQGSDSMIRESIRLGNELLADDNVDELEKIRIRAYIKDLNMKLKTIQVEADSEQERADTITREKFLLNNNEEPIVQEKPINEQFTERRGEWDWSSLDEQQQVVPNSPLRIDSVDQTINLKEYVVTREDSSSDKQWGSSEEKLEQWRYWNYKLDGFLSNVKGRLDKVSEEPRDKNDIDEKLQDVKKCKEDIENYESEVVSALECAKMVLKDKNIDEKLKDDVRAYITELEIQLKTSHRKAVHVEHRLARLHDIFDRELVDEEFHVTYRNRAEWELNFSDEEKEDEIIHSMFERGLPHDYFDHLHDNMTPEEKIRAEKDRKLTVWKNWKNKLDELISRLTIKLDRVRSTDGPTDWKTVRERRDEAEDCTEEIEESEPMIREAFDHCDDLLSDPYLAPQEKQDIESYLSYAQVKLRNIHKDAADEEERLNILWHNTLHPRLVIQDQEQIVLEQPVYQQFSTREGFDFEFEDEHVNEEVQKKHTTRGEFDLHFDDVDQSKEEKKRLAQSYITILLGDLTPEQRNDAKKAEKLENWRMWQSRLDSFLERQRKHLHYVVKSDPPPERPAVREILDEATECKEEIEDCKPRVMNAVLCANELLQDDDIDQDEKDDIKRYVKELETKLHDMYTEACDEEDRLYEMLEKLPKDKDEQNRNQQVDEELHHVRYVERPDFEFQFGDEGHPDEVVHAMFLPSKPIHDYIWDLHDDLDLDQRHEAEKRDILGKWNNWKLYLDDMVHHLDRRLNRVKETPKNRNDVIEQRDEAKELQEDIEDSKPTLRKAIDSANDILARDDVTDDEKDDVKNYVEQLTVQLRRIRDNAADEERKLNPLLDKEPGEPTPDSQLVHEFHSSETKDRPFWEISFEDDVDGNRKNRLEKERDQKMDVWFEHRDKLNKLSETERSSLLDIMSMPTPINQEQIDEQIAKTENYLGRLAEIMPVLRQSYGYGNDLLADEELPEKDKDIVEDDMRKIRDELSGSKREVEDHYQKLKKLPDETAVPIVIQTVEEVQAEPDMFEDQSRKRAEMEEKLSLWRNSRDHLNELLVQLNSKLIKAKSVDTPHNRKEIKDKINEIKICKEGLDALDPEFNETKARVEVIINDDDIDDEEKRPIRRYMSELESRRLALRNQCVDESTRREIELAQLDSEKSEKFSKWRKWRELVRDLLDNFNGKLNKVKNSETPTNRKAIEDQLVVLRDSENGLHSSNPEIQFALEYGKHLSEDDLLDVNEQKTVREDTDKFEKNLENLKMDIDSEKERLNDALEKSEAVIRENLAKWSNKKRSVRPSFDKLQNKIGVLKFKLKPRDKQEIVKRLDEVEECKAELNQVEPNVLSCIDYGGELIRDTNLGSTETISDDIDELKRDLRKLKQDIADQQTTLKKLSDEEDQIKREKQQKYNDSKKEIQDHLFSLREKLKRLSKSTDDTRKDNKYKEEILELSKDFSRDLENLVDEVRDLKDYGNNFIDDANLDDRETRQIRDDISGFEIDLKELRKDNDTLKLTIDKMSEQKLSAEDHPDMDEWRDRVKRVLLGLEVAEDRLFDTTDLNTRAEINDRLDEVKELNIGFEETEPQFLETIDRGEELLKNQEIPDTNKEEISVDLLSMTKYWGKLKSDGLAKEQSLEDLLLSNADQTDELVAWHEHCDDMQAWVDDTISLLDTRPLIISGSFGTMKRQQTVTEEILEELVQKQPHVNTIIDDGNRLLDDQSCGTDEKKDIHDKMSKLYSDWDRLSVTLTTRQENIQDLIVKLEQQHKDLEEVWRKQYGPLRKWITGAQARLNKDYAIAPDLDTVKKQREDIENFQEEKDARASEMTEITQMADNILKGPQVNEEEKTIIQDEMQELQRGWNELEESLAWKQNRIEDTIRKLENQREDKLRKWQEGIHDVNPWISKTLVNITPEPTLASDVDSAYDQIDEFQNHVRDAPIYQDKVTNLNEFSSNLLTDPCLGEDERNKVRSEMDGCNKQWNNFVNIANSRQSRLENNLTKLENQQNDDYNLWTTRSGRASELLDKFEADLPMVDKPLATQLEDVEKQEQDFDVFANQVELNETQINDTFDLGEDIVKDTKKAKAKRDGVQGQLNVLKSRWDRIKDFVDLRKARLQETAKRLRENRKRKIEKWEETTNEFDLFLSAAERDIRSSDTIGDDLTTVKRHNEKFKVVMSKVRSQKRKVFEYGQYTDDVINDLQLDAVSRDHIKIEKEARIDRWGHIEDMINSHQAKLKHKQTELEKGQAEMDGWKNRLNNVNSKITTLEKANEIPVGQDQDTIEKQRQDIKTLNMEKDAIEGHVSGFLSFSEELMDKPGITTENRRLIDKQCNNVELHWHKAKGDLERREKSLEEKQDSLNRRQKNLLSEWETRQSAVCDWLTDTSKKLKELDASAKNIDAVKEQTLKLQHVRKDVTGYEKHVRNMEDFADTLILEPGIHSSEKGLVTREKQSIRERWESLNTAAHNAQKKLGSRMDDLEGEQTRRLNDWRKQCQPLDNWLNETETEVEAYEPVAYDIPMVERQRRENQSTMRAIELKRPQIGQLDGVANVLRNESFIGLEEKVKIQNVTESMKERFEALDDAVNIRQADIENKLSELQEEERLRKKQEEVERQRREEERKQREMVRRKEEEERLRRDQEEREKLEEEQRRRDYEDKKRQEELERLQLEQERRKREEEQEKKRKEEEDRRAEEDRKWKEEQHKKYTILYEPRLSKPIEQEIMVQQEIMVESMQSPDGWDDSFSEAEAFTRQDLDAWRDDANGLRQWMKEKESVLDDDSDDEHYVVLKQERKKLMRLEKEVVEYEPKYEDVKTRYGTLKDNEYLNSDDKQSLDEDMDDINTRWGKMAAARDLKVKRVEDKISRKEKKKLNDLIDCRADIKNLNDWITNKNNQFDTFEPLADDLPTLLIQRNELKQFSKEVADKDPQFTGVIQSANILAKDPTLSPDESIVLQEDADNCEGRWDTLNDRVKERVDGVVHVLPSMQKNQKRLMDDWEDKLDRFRKSIKKSENTLDDQKSKWPAGEDAHVPKIDLTDELRKKVEQNESIDWRTVVDTSNERLAKKRVRLQRIQREKRNRKWSILETIKGMFGFGKRQKTTGVNLDNFIVHLEDHEDLMQEVSSLQRPANEIILSSNELMNSDNLEKININKVDSDMRGINNQWNHLNVHVIERENRLEQLAKEIEDEYVEFDTWRENCESMNLFLNECQRLQKEEEKIGSDIKTLQEQSHDCKEFQKELVEYRPQTENLFDMSQRLIDSGRLDKLDIEGVEHTRDALKRRWEGANEHVKNRQDSIDAKLLDMMKEDADGRLWKWRDQSWKLETKLTDTHRRLNSDVDDNDFVAIHQSAVELEQLQSAMDDVFSTHSELTDTGRDLVDAKNLHPHEEDEVTEALDTLSVHLGNIEQSTKEKKLKIKDANKKFFLRSLSSMDNTAKDLEEGVNTNFSDVGANINEVQKQRTNIETFEALLLSEEYKLEDLKTKLHESKEKGLVDDEEEANILKEIKRLEEKHSRINDAHDQNKKRLTQTLVVLHEELIEEINDWMNDTENQINSFTIHPDDVKTLKDDYASHNELKEEITTFEPTFKGAIVLSRKILDDEVVDEERAESYKNEIKTLNERMDVINLKMMDNGTKFSNAFAMYLTTRLDDAEVSLTQAESKLNQSKDSSYVDLNSCKKQLEISKSNLDEAHETKREVDDIIDEADGLIKDGFFKKHEQDYFSPRIDKIGSRNETMVEDASKNHKRLFDAYIVLLRQHLGRMDAWLFKAEERMRLTTDDIKSDYEEVKQNLEEHQQFQEEIREHSMVSIILELDITDPVVNQSIQRQVKSLSERWAILWRWSEERRTHLLRMISNWEKFRDEQIALLNWLSSKERVLKEMGATDLSNEVEVKHHLNVLEKLQSKLDEQGMKLQELHKAGDELLRDVHEKDQTCKDIKKQLRDFDDCWNNIAKQVIERIHTLETSQSKLIEYHSEMNDTVKWMDETEEILGSFKVDMPPEDATKLQGKLDIKCDERPRYQVRVDRINRLGKDLQGTIDQPSYDFINEELKPFNQRWGNVSEQLENLSDSGYPTPERSDCCLISIMRQKLGICQ